LAPLHGWLGEMKQISTSNLEKFAKEATI
jgi:CRP-like cAMP-binding protein